MPSLQRAIRDSFFNSHQTVITPFNIILIWLSWPENLWTIGWSIFDTWMFGFGKFWKMKLQSISYFQSHSRWNSGLVYWHQHNQSLWNYLLATTLRNKKRRLDNGSWFFLVYSSSSMYISTCFIYLWYLYQGAYKILYVK